MEKKKQIFTLHGASSCILDVMKALNSWIRTNKDRPMHTVGEIIICKSKEMSNNFIVV